MPLSFQTVDSYRSFGRCVSLSNGLIEALVTVERGPRVIYFGMCGGPNLFWTDDERSVITKSNALESAFGRGDTYEILGGHRLWAAPEHPVDTYYPDNTPTDAVKTERGWIFTEPARERLGLQFRVELRMAENAPSLSVRHRIENTGGETVTLAPWAITQLAPGGTLLLPQSKRNTGLLADRQFAVWPYTDMGDARLGWFDDYITLRQDSNVNRALKIGTHNLSGWAVYQNQGYVFKKNWSPLPSGLYPDSGCSFEMYTNRYFLEMETLGCLETLAPGRFAMHEELWSCCAEPNALSAEALLQTHGKANGLSHNV